VICVQERRKVPGSEIGGADYKQSHATHYDPVGWWVVLQAERREAGRGKKRESERREQTGEKKG
jgi:hypothetical protein